VGSGKDYELLIQLIEEAKGKQWILTFTREYQYLLEIENKTLNWLNKMNQISEPKPQIMGEEEGDAEELVEALEKLLSEGIPLPLCKVSQVQKQLKREKWLKKLREMSLSEKVRLKQVEILAKESGHQDI